MYDSISPSLASCSGASLMKQWHSTHQRTSSLSTTRSLSSSSLARTTKWVKEACWEPAGKCVWACVYVAQNCKDCIHRISSVLTLCWCFSLCLLKNKLVSSVGSKCSSTARCWYAGWETPAALSAVEDASAERFGPVNLRSSTHWAGAPSSSCLCHDANIRLLTQTARKTPREHASITFAE